MQTDSNDVNNCIIQHVDDINLITAAATVASSITRQETAILATSTTSTTSTTTAISLYVAD